MSIDSTAPSSVLLDNVAHWLIKRALAGADLDEIVGGFCERLAAAGLPLARIHLTFSMLHPLYRATGFTWRRGEGTKSESYGHVPYSQKDRFTTSPYFYMLKNKLDHVRRRIHANAPSEFPIFDDLKQFGMTDYLAFVQSFDQDTNQGMMGSWATDLEGGFGDATISALLHMQNQLAVATRIAVLSKLAGNMLSTYLGSDAGQRVLSGQIKRGDGETIRAALVMADMRESTRLAEEHGRQVYIETLNRFFDAVAAPFSRGGGHILSFLGDGFLAAYPCDRHKTQSQIACKEALAAALTATTRMAEFNRKRKDEGLWEIKFGIGLHVGNVMFGNVGLNDRLAFSAFGVAVNEVQRLENLTKKYSGGIVASSAFADYCGGNWITLGKEKLRGKKVDMTVYAPGVEHLATVESVETVEAAESALSDAEHLFVLHRESQKAPGLVEVQ